jgi:hypothetical protein
LAQKHGLETARSYSIFCPGGSPHTIENYLLIPIEGAGFVVIKQEIDID